MKRLAIITISSLLAITCLSESVLLPITPAQNAELARDIGRNLRSRGSGITTNADFHGNWYHCDAATMTNVLRDVGFTNQAREVVFVRRFGSAVKVEFKP